MIKKQFSTKTLNISEIQIDNSCVGSRWDLINIDQLAKLIAIILMGQAKYAGYIIKELIPAKPAFTIEELKNEAIIKLSIQSNKQTPKTGYPIWQRDGLVFECISWIAAQQVCGKNTFLQDPHISSTSQGIDGLMIELSDDKSTLNRAIIFEDKCSSNPRRKFKQEIIPGFLERHKNKRSAELVAAAVSLIKLSGIDDLVATQISSKIFNKNSRYYRASFALTHDCDSDKQRKKLFLGYDALEGIKPVQRMGGCFYTDDELRPWFDKLANKSIAYIKSL